MTMTRFPLTTTAVDHDGCAALHAATVEVLEKTGVEVHHERALDLLARAGAKVEGTRVRMSGALLDEALAMVPRSVTLTSRSETTSGIELKAGPVYYGTGSDCLYILGPGPRDRRPATLSDVEEMAALQERLPNTDFVMSMAHAAELSPASADAAQFAAMLRGTSKPLIMVPPDGRSLPVLKEMAAACGAADSFAIYAMPTPPLVHGRDSAERLVGCAELGIPMVYCTALLQGATAPASRAGFVVLSNAETLSGLVLSQLVSPGAPFVYGVAQGQMNSRTAHVVYSGPEEMAVQQACADLARFYGLPSFGWGGCSDSLMLDDQWAFESGMTLLTAAMSGVTLLHDIGYVASGTASSYEAVVVMDEMVRWVKAYLEGVSIDTEALAVDEIAAAGPGGTHLARRHTRRHYRDYVVPELVSQDTHEAWEAVGGSSLLERTAERTRELRAAERLVALGDDVLAQLDALVEQARALREG
jgi:trimethylamine--corrinoid protein Co-methyltransferase